MFQAYKEFIENALRAIITWQMGTTFSDYLKVVIGLFLLILTVVVIGLTFWFIFFIPRIAYNRFIGKINDQIEKCIEEIRATKESFNEELEKSLSLLKRKKKKNILLFISFVIILYVPIVLPLILIGFDFVYPIFKNVSFLIIGVLLYTPIALLMGKKMLEDNCGYWDSEFWGMFLGVNCLVGVASVLLYYLVKLLVQ